MYYYTVCATGIRPLRVALIWQVASSKKRVLSSQISWQEDLTWCVCDMTSLRHQIACHPQLNTLRNRGAS